MPTWPTEGPFGPRDTHMLEEMIPAEDHILCCHKSYCEERQRERERLQRKNTFMIDSFCTVYSVNARLLLTKQHDNKGKQLKTNKQEASKRWESRFANRLLNLHLRDSCLIQRDINRSQFVFTAQKGVLDILKNAAMRTLSPEARFPRRNCCSLQNVPVCSCLPSANDLSFDLQLKT